MIRNSPAKVAEPGTASAMIPVAMSIVASTGRPQAMPPSASSSPVWRRSTIPTRRNISRSEGVRDRLQDGAVDPEVVQREDAEDDEPICAIDE